MGRRSRCPGWALALAVAGGCVARGPAVEPRVDVLLITLDTTRADRLGVYGYERGTSPNLDRLASEGVVFDRAIAQAAVTPVSHASIFTGLNPYRHGLRTLHGLTASRISDRVDTLAELWRRQGGRAAAFVSAYPAGSAFGLDRGFAPFDESFGHGEAEPRDENGIVNTGLAQRRADATTDAAISWLRSGADPDRPLLLWVHFFDPHDPYVLPPPELSASFPAFSPAPADVLRAVYDAEIAFVDSQIGRLLTAWRELRRWDGTVAVVVADHGQGLGDHDWWSHGILYQEEIRVPLIVRWPEGPAGRRVAATARSIDILPTLLEAAGLPVPPGLDGRSLRPLVSAREAGAARPAYADALGILTYARPDRRAAPDRKEDRLYSLFDGDLKLIYHQLDPAASELYDLASDPGEERNLAMERPADVARLVARLEARGALTDLPAPGGSPDGERERRLRSLGYVD